MSIEGREHRYAVFVPEGYRADQQWPAILFLHGFGGAGHDGVSQVGTGFGKYMASHCHDFNFIVIFPQSSFDWRGREAQDEAMAVLDEVQRNYSIDPDRVTLAGISLGGYGAYMLAARHRDRFAALVAMSGLAEEHVASRLTYLPVRCYHYETDAIIGHVNSQRMVEKINTAGGDATLFTYPGLGHMVWEQACEPGLFEWISQQHRGAQHASSKQ
jgi:predicted peptidase